MRTRSEKSDVTNGRRSRTRRVNKGRRYPADPPTIEEFVAVMRHAGDGTH